MLHLYTNLRQLPFEQLMAVYEEGNRENGKILAPFDPEARQLQLAEEDFYDYLRAFFAVPGAQYAVWEADGAAVSALRLEPYRDGLLLEALETAPQKRRQGYATELIQAVQQHLEGGGVVRLYSHVSKKNVPSLNVHRRCGFQIIEDCAVYIDGSVSSRAYTLRYKNNFPNFQKTI